VAAAAFVVAGLLLMAFLDDVAYGIAVAAIGAVALLLALTSREVRAALPWARWRVDPKDLLAEAAFYAIVVGLFSLAFRGFTTDNTLGMFLSFGGGLVLGVAGPVIYTVWVRRRPLASLGITLKGWRGVVAPALLFAGVQFAITLWGYDLPRPVDWVPLLSMALTVGVFESIFFRGFIQGRLEAAFGTAPAVAGAAILYSLYHVGYGMGAEEMVFLLGLGIVYAVAFRLVNNVLVLWPLLTPLGSFFAQLESGELSGELPWAAIMGFADVIGLMAAVIWLARRHERKLDRPSDEKPPAHWFEVRVVGPRG
jgi:membrane protease YdiL (CAAX protease family)